MKNMLKSFLFLVSGFCFISSIHGQNNRDFEWAKSIDIYSSVLTEIQNNYVEDVEPGKLNVIAIKAMLKSLDPYTQFISESEIEDVKFMTTGQYGGIGSVIQKREDYVIISYPYKGFPADKAGLKAGDKIIAIDGKDMKGRNVSDVSALMRGEPSTSFEMTFLRYGEQTPRKEKIIREVIKIDDIPYYGVLENNIGYIKLTGFTENAGHKVKTALEKLQQQATLTGCILDLRGNPGGLLGEAVNITNIFVEKDEVIVKTAGKLADKNRTYKTRFPVVAPDLPLVVLINNQSASASEIVSGAVQDLDRGVVVGERSYGKGLVQNIVPLTYNTRAKITIAKYFIPSGRCIQEIDYSVNNNAGDSIKGEKSNKIFTTRNGREVIDAHGIYPDVAVSPDSLPMIAITLFAKNIIFDYATKFYFENPTIDSADQFAITDEIYSDFKEFLRDKEFEYTTETEKAVEVLKNKATEEKYLSFLEEHIELLKADLLDHKKNDIDTFKDDISSLLRSEIVLRYYYDRGVILSNMKEDVQLHKAIELLSNPSLYGDILSGKK